MLNIHTAPCVWAGVCACMCVYIYECVCVCSRCYLYTSSSVNGSSSPDGWTGKAVIRKLSVKIEQLTGMSGWIQAWGLLCVCLWGCMWCGDAGSEPESIHMCLLCPAWVLAPSDQLKPCCSDTRTSGWGIVNHVPVVLSSPSSSSALLTMKSV